MKRTRRIHGAAIKMQVAFVACKGDKTLSDVATQFSSRAFRPDNGTAHAARAV
ncbi:MAG: hypothetical protein ABI604_09785 [Nitrospirota bacterium]